MKQIVKYTVLIVFVLVSAFFAVSYITEFRPGAETPVGEYFGRDGHGCAACEGCIGSAACAGCAENVLPDKLKILSWNIGYAGLGDNMDFCVDGGKKVRDSRERTEKNLSDIIYVLREENADICLLQEVDEKSHRTYNINEIEAISKAMPGYYVYYAPNFKTWFVPSPLKEPIGRVCSGVVILSRMKPSAVRRVSYPSAFSFPVRMFNLKRCLLEADFKTSEGKTVHIGNTHNTAFDTGGMRTVEDEFIKERIARYTKAGEAFVTGGDWNQCPPQYTPSREELENRFFAPEIFDTTGINSFAGILCDSSRYTMRYNDKPYGPGSVRSVLDFFIISRDGTEAPEFETISLNFRSSDHNPVRAGIVYHQADQHTICSLCSQRRNNSYNNFPSVNE